MIGNIVSVLTMGLVAVIIYQWINANSNGPKVLGSLGSDITGFFATLMGK